MDRRRTSVRFARPLAAALVLVVAAAGCGRDTVVGRSAAIDINGTEYSAEDLFARIEDQRAVIDAQRRSGSLEEQRAAAESQGQQVSSKEQYAREIHNALKRYADGDGKLGTREVADDLTDLVRTELYRQILDRRGGKVTEAQRSEAKDQLLTQLKEAKLTEDNLPKAFVDQLVEAGALQEAIKLTAPADITPPPMSDADYQAKLRGIYDADPTAYGDLCLSVIVTATVEEAQAALERVRGGEDFATVAKGVSVDTTAAENGGDVGCVPRAQVATILPEATTAAAGDLLGPGADQQSGAFLIGKVTKIDQKSFEDVQATIAQANPNNDPTATAQILNNFVDDQLKAAARKAKVTIDPRFGRWDPEGVQVLPPG